MADRLMGAVLQASKNNDVATLKDIIALVPAAAKASNQIGQTGLHVASIWGNCEAAQLLIDAGADVDAQNQFGVTPLASAVGKDTSLDIVKLLLDNGADPRIKAANGTTCLQVAKSDAMRALLGAPALKGHAAVIAADRAALEALLTDGTLDLSDQDSDGDTVLHLAVQAAVGDTPVAVSEVQGTSPSATKTVLDLLLEHSAAKGFAKAQRLHNDAGFMPLHIAARRGNNVVCEALLQVSQVRGKSGKSSVR